MIIFDEYTKAQELLEHIKLKPPSFRELILIAKYLRFIGKNDTQIRSDLEAYCEKCNPEFNRIMHGKRITSALHTAKKLSLRRSLPVPITRKEIDLIKKFDNYKLEKVVFVMLVTAKFFRLVNPRHSGDQNPICMVQGRFREFLSLARINVNKKDRNAMKYILGQSGLVEATTRDTLYRITFADFCGEPEVVITHFEDMVSFYPYYCEVCGIKINNAKKNQKMCEECWKEKNKIIQKNQMRQKRSKI